MSTDAKRWFVGFFFALLLQTATLGFLLGRMSERVDSVKGVTDTLLKLQLDKSASAR